MRNPSLSAGHLFRNPPLVVPALAGPQTPDPSARHPLPISSSFSFSSSSSIPTPRFAPFAPSAPSRECPPARIRLFSTLVSSMLCLGPPHERNTRHRPDLQRTRQPPFDGGPPPVASPSPWTSSSWTAVRPMAPASSPTNSPPSTPPSTSSTKPKNSGLGRAYCAGFAWALEQRIRVHHGNGRRFLPQPRRHPALRRGRRRGRPRPRLALRRRHPRHQLAAPPAHARPGAGKYVRLITGMPFSDPTGGFKCFRRRALQIH